MFQSRVEKYEYSIMIGCQFVSRELYNTAYLGGVTDLYIKGSFHPIVFSVCVQPNNKMRVSFS